MWVFTQEGFVSAVRTPDREGYLTVRSRDKESLGTLAETTNQTIATTPHRDYPYRVFVTYDNFKSWLTQHVDDLDYGNFKDQVHVTRGYDYVRALHGVWDVMHDVEDSTARRRGA